MAKQSENIVGEVNLLAATTVVKGDINTDSDIRIDGKLDGTLNTKGRLIIGPKGEIKGEVNCKSAEIEGSAEGKIHCTELISLRSTAKFNGELVTGQLMIEPGALFSGNCKMQDITSNKSK